MAGTPQSHAYFIRYARETFNVPPFVVAGALEGQPDPLDQDAAQAALLAFLQEYFPEYLPAAQGLTGRLTTPQGPVEMPTGSLLVRDLSSPTGWTVVPPPASAGRLLASGPPGEGPTWTSSTGGTSLTPVGQWSVSTTYHAGDVVGRNGSSWAALRTNTGVVPVEGADWTELAGAGGIDATGYAAGQVPAATGTGSFAPVAVPTLAAVQDLQAQVAALQAQVAAIVPAGGGSLSRLTLQDTEDQPSDAEDGVIGELRYVAPQITRADGSSYRQAQGFYLKVNDGSPTGRWLDYVVFPAMAEGSVPIFLGLGDPDFNRPPDQPSAYFGRNPEGGGQFRLGDQSGWDPAPTGRIGPPEEHGFYIGTNYPASLRPGDMVASVTYDTDGVTPLSIQWNMEDGAPDPGDGGGVTPPSQMPAPTGFSATAKPGYVQLNWNAPADIGDESFVGFWRIEAKPSGQPDSAYVTVAITSGATPVPTNLATGIAKRVQGTSIYDVRDAAVRSSGTALVYAITALDASLGSASTRVPLGAAVTVVAPSAQVVATRALSAGASSITTLTGSLAQATAGTHGTVIGSDARAPAQGDVVVLLMHFSNVTSTTRLGTTAFLRPTGQTTGGVTLTMMPRDDGVQAEFRTDDTSGTSVAVYKGVLPAGFPATFDLVFPASGTNEAWLRVYDAATADADDDYLLAFQKFNTGTSASAAMQAPQRRSDADGSLVEHFAVFDSGSGAAAGSRVAWSGTGVTKVGEGAAGSGTTGRLVSEATGGTLAYNALTGSAVTATIATPAQAPDFGAMITMLVRKLGAEPDPSVVQPAVGTGGGGGGGGGGGTPGSATVFPVGDASLSAAGLTIFPVTATSTLQQWAPGGVFHSGTSHDTSLARRSVPVADIAGANYYEIQRDPNGSAYVVRVRTFANHYDYWTADAYRSEAQHGNAPLTYGAQFFAAFSVLLKSTGTPNYPRGGKGASFRTSSSSKGDWCDINQNHGQDPVGSKYNGPFSLSLNGARLELFVNLENSTSLGSWPWVASSIVTDKVIKVLWRFVFLTSGGYAELFVDLADGAGLVSRWNMTGQTARDSGQACDFRNGCYQGPFKPAAYTADFLYGQAAMAKIATNASGAQVATARDLVTRAAFGESL